MKTHKNPGRKAQSGSVQSGPKPFSALKPQTSPSSKPDTKKEPALLKLEGKKWRVENHNFSNLVIDDATLQIKSKTNSIAVDSHKQLGLVFDGVLDIVDIIINSRDIKVQVMGKATTISITKHGCQSCLNKNSLDYCEIVSAKASELNVLIPIKSSDFNEFPVTKQFKTPWNGQKCHSDRNRWINECVGPVPSPFTPRDTSGWRRFFSRFPLPFCS